MKCKCVCGVVNLRVLSVVFFLINEINTKSKRVYVGFVPLFCFCLVRPLLDEPSVSDPKRAALESPVAVPSLNVSDPQKAPLGSAAHLRPGQSEGRRDSFSLSAQAELNNRKRKEMEEDMEMEELESIMSLDMDVFDELPAVESQHAQTSTRSSHEERGIVATAEASSASKRPRLYFEDGPDRRQRCDVRRENHSEKPERPAVSVRTEEPLSLSERSSTRGESSKRPQMSSSATHSDVKACEDAEARRYFCL